MPQLSSTQRYEIEVLKRLKYGVSEIGEVSDEKMQFPAHHRWVKIGWAEGERLLKINGLHCFNRHTG